MNTELNEIKHNELTTIEAKRAALLAMLENIETAPVDPMPLQREYLDVNTLNVGQKWRGMYAGIQSREQINQTTGEVQTMRAVVLICKNEKGELVAYENATKMLVATVGDSEYRGEIVPMQTYILLEFLGKRKNKGNNFYSANWKFSKILA